MRNGFCHPRQYAGNQAGASLGAGDGQCGNERSNSLALQLQARGRQSAHRPRLQGGEALTPRRLWRGFSFQARFFLKAYMPIKVKSAEVVFHRHAERVRHNSGKLKFFFHFFVKEFLALCYSTKILVQIRAI